MKAIYLINYKKNPKEHEKGLTHSAFYFFLPCFSLSGEELPQNFAYIKSLLIFTLGENSLHAALLYKFQNGENSFEYNLFLCTHLVFVNLLFQYNIRITPILYDGVSQVQTSSDRILVFAFMVIMLSGSWQRQYRNIYHLSLARDLDTDPDSGLDLDKLFSN